MSDSNIYTALAQSVLSIKRPSRDREDAEGKSRGRQRKTEGCLCSKTEGGVLVMPSVVTTSGLDEVLHPTHLEENIPEKRYIDSLSNKNRRWLASA